MVHPVLNYCHLKQIEIFIRLISLISLYGYETERTYDIHVSVHHDIVYENDQQGATV